MKGPPFVRYVAGLLTGIILYVQWPDVLLIPLTIFVVGMALFAWGFFKTSSSTIKPIQLGQGVGALFILVALGWAITYTHTDSNRPTNILHITDTLQAYEGVIASQPEERAKTYRVELAVRRGRCKHVFAGSSPSDQASWKPVSGRV